MRVLSAICFTGLASLTLAGPVMAQSKKDMVATDAMLTQRVDTLEQRYLTGDPAAERLMQRMDTLESSQRALTGEIEQLRYERDSLRTDVQALANDLSGLKALAGEMRQHLDAVELASQPRTGASQGYQSAPSVSSGGSWQEGSAVQAAPRVAQLPMVDMAELQNLGQQKLMAGDFTGAQQAYSQYIELNPSAPDVGNAHFWLAETYFVKSGYAEAVDSYIASMRAAPEGEKAPNAMVGLAASLRGLGDTDSACQTLDGFSAQFPSAPSDIAQKAKVERQRAGCS